MAVYRYSKDVLLKEGESARLNISFTQAGIAAHHMIDIPGPNDKQGLDRYSVVLGGLDDLAKERTLIITKAVSVNPNEDEIGITYAINGEPVAEHSNSKVDDPSPMIVVTLYFKKA